MWKKYSDRTPGDGAGGKDRTLQCLVSFTEVFTNPPVFHIREIMKKRKITKLVISVRVRSTQTKDTLTSAEWNQQEGKNWRKKEVKLSRMKTSGNSVKVTDEEYVWSIFKSSLFSLTEGINPYNKWKIIINSFDGIILRRNKYFFGAGKTAMSNSTASYSIECVAWADEMKTKTQHPYSDAIRESKNCVFFLNKALIFPI